MTLENALAKVTISIDETYFSEENTPGKYDKVFNPNDFKRSELSTVFSVQVDLRNRQYSVALIGDHNCSEENCAVLENNVLTVLQGWDVLQIDLFCAQLIKCCSLDSMAPNIGIYRVNDGYLIHGEMDLRCLMIACTNCGTSLDMISLFQSLERRSSRSSQIAFAYMTSATTITK